MSHVMGKYLDYHDKLPFAECIPRKREDVKSRDPPRPSWNRPKQLMTKTGYCQCGNHAIRCFQDEGDITQSTPFFLPVQLIEIIFEIHVQGRTATITSCEASIHDISLDTGSTTTAIANEASTDWTCNNKHSTLMMSAQDNQTPPSGTTLKRRWVSRPGFYIWWKLWRSS